PDRVLQQLGRVLDLAGVVAGRVDNDVPFAPLERAQVLLRVLGLRRPPPLPDQRLDVGEQLRVAAPAVEQGQHVPAGPRRLDDRRPEEAGPAEDQDALRRGRSRARGFAPRGARRGRDRGRGGGDAAEEGPARRAARGLVGHGAALRSRRPGRESPQARPFACLQLSTVFHSSIVIVIGPTPPGTGVICDALRLTASKSTSPTRRKPLLRLGSSTRFTPTSMTTAPSFTISAVTVPGTPAAAMTM